MIIMDKVCEYILKNLDKTLRFNPEDRGTLIGVPMPYNVPCMKQTFNELYYWDTYFLNKGLIAAGNVEQAKNNCLDVKFLIDKFGYMPNGNRTFFLGASQPPFFAMMVKDVFEVERDISFLYSALESVKKEYFFWNTKRLAPNGLNVYGSDRSGDSHLSFYRDIVVPRLHYNGGEDKEKAIAIGEHYAAEAESGWDFNPRFEGHCKNFNPVDLNCNLYEYETFIAEAEKYLGISDGSEWTEKAFVRAEKINELMWNEQRKCYFDYNFVCGKQSTVVSAASYYPFLRNVAGKKKIDSIDDLTAVLELPYGISATENTENKIYQWSYPAMWAPLQAIAFDSLVRCGKKNAAKRIAEKYLSVVKTNFEKSGGLWEKYNGLNGEVYDTIEYGTPEMMGWTAGVYLYFVKNL